MGPDAPVEEGVVERGAGERDELAPLFAGVQHGGDERLAVGLARVVDEARLVAAETGVCLVPVSVTRLRRDNVEYRELDDPTAISPNIMSCRKNDSSPDLASILGLLRDIYAEHNVEFGR